MTVSTPGTRVAVIGLGGMGGGMAYRLVEEGFDVTVHNRTASKAAELAEAGATVADTAADAVKGVDVVLISLSDEAAVEDVLFGQVVTALEPGTLVLNTSTVSSSYARTALARLAAARVRPVEACVVGNPPMARSGGLRIFAAGDQENVDAARPILDVLGQQVLYLGAPGTASAMKLAFNLLLAAQTVAMAEAVNFGVAAGLDRDMLIEAMANSGFSSPVLSFRSEFMRTQVYEPAAFRATLMEKDLRLMATDAAELQLALPITDSLARRYAAVVAAGHGDRDAAIVIDSP